MVVQGREIVLSVEHQSHQELWHWEITGEDGLILTRGAEATRLAAQVAAQHAFETRLRKAKISKWGFTGYRWREVVA